MSCHEAARPLGNQSDALEYPDPSQKTSNCNVRKSYSSGIQRRARTWRVLFSRPIATEPPGQDAQFRPGEFVNIAFAVWDG
jgi:hypothetical protein